MNCKKVKTLLIAAVVALSTLTVTSNAYAIRESVTTKRLGGSNRFQTAIEISKEYVAKAKEPVKSVILCSASGYADSVSVTPFCCLCKCAYPFNRERYITV